MKCKFCRGEIPPCPIRREVLYCSRKCRAAHYNLKMLRGASIHDLLVMWKSSYRNRHLLTQISQAVGEWVEEDRKRVGVEGATK